MAKKTNKATETMKALLAEQHKINNGYDSALQTAQAEYNQLEKHFFDAEATAKETHKRYVLGQATNAEYQTAKKKMQHADEALRDAGHKLDEIDKYRKEDLMELLYKLESNLLAYGKEKVNSEQAMHYKALNAKYEYLKTLREIGNEHKEVWEVSKEIEELKVKLGLKNYNYHSYDSVYTSLFSNSFNGKQGINITDNELRDVFIYGTYDKKLLDEIEKGKQTGLIK